MTKIIHAAIAAPGSGKTQALIDQLTNCIKFGEKLVVALPTLILSDDIINRMKSKGLNPKVINSHDKPGFTAHSINGTLRNGNEDLILVTHEGLRLSNPALLCDYTLVIDEVPDIFEIKHILNIRDIDAERILSETDQEDSQIFIKQGRTEKIKDQVGIFKSSQKHESIVSTLSAQEFSIFDALLKNGTVISDSCMRDGKKYFNFYITKEKEIFKHISSAKQTHILAANIEGGIFDIFAKKKGYQYQKSKFTPKPLKYNCEIKLHPMLAEPWSKRKVLKDKSGTECNEHLGKHNYQIIDTVFMTAINNKPNEKFIAIQNSWGKFSNEYLPEGSDTVIEFLNLDCRGINTHQDKTAAILLFSGKPSPNDMKCLRMLSKKHSIDIRELVSAWTVKNKLEASLQAVTRTAVRVQGNTKPVFFYVQDQEVAEYLKNTYMPNAVIDNSLALTPPKTQDGRMKISPTEDQKMQVFIDTTYSAGVARKDINKALVRNWSISETTARRRTAHLKNKPRPVSHSNLEDLTRFFA
ncbi:DEAD/DEAH box helicase family protein [Pseudomonas nitroreducens]|uniref:DEAD/DEAH box helicase family protein n=1 Tax=Pseudomonas nitroreducens TaxID=46680 RepID=A0ABS0KK98_PSENT|nr:DEAD/DEAH box helicase family protein [Pseudomonas nitroreducens]MBG6288501.1 DEAD/DEAH box helicase family protein [Pseudomonas nitroreducens]